MKYRYIAGGSSQISIAFNYRISPSSVSQILREILAAIWETMSETFLPTPTVNSMQSTARDYWNKWNFPNCVGAIDGKYVKVKCPPNSGSDFFNYKGYFSVVLLAIADANYKFSVVDIGAKGSQSDSGIFSNSTFGHLLYSNQLDLPPEKPLPNTTSTMPHAFLGHDAFPLLQNLLRPYPGKFNKKPERIFNYRLSRARRVVENCFGIWAARFRIFHTTINADLDLADLIVKATTVLHNFLMEENDLGGLTVDAVDEKGNERPGNWRDMVESDVGVSNIGRFGTNNHTKVAEIVRNTFKVYFNSDTGSVPWQAESINK